MQRNRHDASTSAMDTRYKAETDGQERCESALCDAVDVVGMSMNAGEVFV